MGNEAINAYEKKPYAKSAWVWYENSNGNTTALNEGEAVCYDQDYGTATAYDGRRLNRVETPDTTNAQYFAGVASRAYAATTGGQFIEIYLPGSVCNIWLNAPATSTINVSFFTFDVTSSYEGFFRYEGLPGVGSAIPLQTVDRSSTAGLCMAKLMEGEESGGVEVVPLVDNDAIGTLMIGGSTLVTGSVIGTGNCTYTLADATSVGLRKKFKVITAEVATSDLVITVTNGRTSALADSALASVTFPDSGTTLNTEITLEWGGAWCFRSATKTLPALA